MPLVCRYPSCNHSNCCKEPNHPGKDAQHVGKARSCIAKCRIPRHIISMCNNGKCYDLENCCNRNHLVHRKVCLEQYNTLKGCEACYGPPYPSSPRMRTNAEEDGKYTEGTKANRKLRRITCCGPCRAKTAVIFVAPVRNRCGKLAAFIDRI